MLMRINNGEKNTEYSLYTKIIREKLSHGNVRAVY